MEKLDRALRLFFRIIIVSGIISWTMYLLTGVTATEDRSPLRVYRLVNMYVVGITWLAMIGCMLADVVIGIFEPRRGCASAAPRREEVRPEFPTFEAAFLEQDRRLDRRERLKRQLDDVNREIETFFAEMDADTRKAWANRPGPYGK